MQLAARGVRIPLDDMVLMGIVNVTPDSFSDGGMYESPDAAVAHGLDLVAQGAAIVDVGGESTRPGADPVPEAEERARVLPVVAELAGRGVVVSIDTRKRGVAEAALTAGAHIVNDTLGEAEDPALAALAADAGAAVVAMHSRGTPKTMTRLAGYDDVVSEVGGWLRGKARRLLEAGVAEDAIVLDPGFGFAKTAHHNLVLLRRLGELTSGPFPVLVGTSRKSFIGKVLGVEAGERVEGTAATVAWARVQGARLARVHDVAPVLRTVRMIEAILGAQDG